MSAASTPRTPRFELPPAPTYSSSSAASDSGLAEWTSKIRALQRQVDADEEEEQRRLEEEIVRARLARMRRNRTGQSGDFGVGMHGIDLAKVQEGLTPDRTTDSDINAQPSNKQSKPNVSVPKPAAKTSASTSSGDKAPISLAEFMGGSASGPRLKRHEPQIDAGVAYDGRTDHGAVHPIFGRGGIAMPGMTGRGGTPAASSTAGYTSSTTASQPAVATPHTAPSDPARSRTMSTSSVARRYVEKIEEQTPTQAQSPRLTGLGIRERRISTPAGNLSGELRVNTPAVASRPLSQISEGRTASPDTRLKSPVAETRPKTPTTGEIRSRTPATGEARSKTPAATEIRPKTPVVEVRAKTPVIVEPRSKTSVVDSRAETSNFESTRAKAPVQSQSPARPGFSGTVPLTSRHQSTSVSTAVPPKSPGPPSPVRTTYSPQPQRGVSPAFLRPQVTSSMKDPTPSISRLQGRGFVQSMVQASGRLEAGAQGSPSSVKSVFSSSSPSPAQGETRDKNARRASVLDRWQPDHNNNNNNATNSPGSSSKTSFPIRSHTTHPKAGQDVPVVKTHDTGRSVRSAVSLPSMPKTPLRKADVLPGTAMDVKLGSSSTMISYIKPTKTGDNPVVSDVNELGVRTDTGEGRSTGAGVGAGGAGVIHAKTPRVSASALPSSPGKPLSHPTKERARKPRKARFEDGGPAASSEGATPSTQAPNQTSLPGLIAEPSASSPASNVVTPRAPADPSSRARSELGPQLRITPPSTSGRVADRWTEPTLIGVKPLPSPSARNRPPPSPKPLGLTGMVGRRALPGLTNPVVHSQNENSAKELDDLPVPPSPNKHTRIPSTGNRALVMEVAQTMNEARVEVDTPEICSLPSMGPSVVEKRKSSYERYAAIAMPPLKEERTPVATPAHTVSKASGESVLGSAAVVDRGAASEASEQPSVNEAERTMIHVEHVDEPLPDVDVEALLKVDNAADFTPNPEMRTISVDVISITNGSVTPITRNTNIFYDTEVLVIVHRAKSRESGLATTKVWFWRGKNSQYGEREEKKSAELARRYNTSPEAVYQQREPAELVSVLGGQLAIRQGTRNHWSSENTAMHVVRSSYGHILIDEINLSIRNLCSGYSYCISVLDSTYVWYGCGSVPAERKAALEYARLMATSVTELTEGEDDGGDEMFWMVVGDPDSYAKADYWRWRSTSVPCEPRCWIVDLTNSDRPVCSVPTLIADPMLQDFVHIIDCSWEFFVLVGKDARAKRSDIMLAINTVMAMSKHVATTKPFSPTVHVLVIPTQLPLDMRLAFRTLDESTLNGGFIPDHMNILSTTEAIEHLRTSSWEKSALKDHTMLPLGLDSSHVPLS